MFRANVYNLEPLSARSREEVHNGVEMVAAFMGHQVVSKECRLKITTDAAGRVDPNKVGFKKLDKMVELHLLAVPLVQSRPEEYMRLGMAGLGSGWAFVDTTPQLAANKGQTMTTTAHEVAHAFGFLLPEAIQQNPHSEGHCNDPHCIMHKHVIDLPHARPPETSPLKRGINIVRNTLRDTYESHGYTTQYDFCLDCKVDFREHGDRNLNQIRAARTLHGQHI